ncbi:hypothetical protein [Seonamhaeicola maritimus]|uniref:Uncharacterized protein n=1 Tax=Seonamhaeicola maritimus TaxID=2591822 RepID=A0A5C7GKX5_9FLAO|nr:hypothetical protein [Seonamhaeicola maritimus]TXG38930.1 hypothetical protein FUA22_03300 [Seonamhaeicola maritimus]
MKKLVFALCFTALCFSCKQKENKVTQSRELTVAEKIAHAHGFQNWDKVHEIEFKFGKRRHWTWNPKTDDVKLTTDSDTIIYNIKSIDTTSYKADEAFINDKFWLLIPFQLVWDTSATISEPTQETGPISKTLMNKITITYSLKGGYTPGDVYDIFYDNDFIIKEWIFRRGGRPEPNLINTFENVQDFNGLKIATDHIGKNGKPLAKLSEIKVILE